MNPSRGIAAALALSILLVAPSAWSDDKELPTPPVPGKPLPAKELKQAARQAELESAHRAVANEWRTALAEVSRRPPLFRTPHIQRNPYMLPSFTRLRDRIL